MRGIDTNIIIRFLMGDSAEEAAKARAIMMAGDIFVPITVMLESEWVLRSTYRLGRREIVSALRDIASISGVAVEGLALFYRALDWVESGMDFADALHLARAEGCSAFVSFDRGLAKAARGRAPIPVVEP